MTSSRTTLSTGLALVAGLGAVFSLSSCSLTTAATPQSSVKVAEAWQNADQKSRILPRDGNLETWWSGLNDPILEELIRQALANSPDILSGLSRIEESRARLGIATSNLLPSVNVKGSGSGSRSRDQDTGITTRSEAYGAGLDASWELDLFGKLRLTRSAALADLAQTEENLQGLRVSLAAEVAKVYVQLRSTETQLGLVRRSLALREETHQLSVWKEEAGTNSALDSLQSKSALDQARSTLPSLEQSLAQTRNQLALLCGREPAALDALLSSAGQVPSFPSTLSSGIPAEVLRQRPDLRAAEKAVEAAANRGSAARRERLPSLSLSGSLSVSGDRVSTVADPQRSIANVAGSLTAPIFSAGRIKQNIRISDAQTQQALIAYEAAVLTALSEVENALIAVKRTQERLEPLTNATTAAREASQLALIQYKSGDKDLLTVLDAQRTELGLEEQLISSTADCTLAHIQLYKALGGGWAAN